MELNFRSQNYINPATRTPPYTVVTFQGKNYRILTRQHTAFLQTAKIWAVFWLLLGLFLLTSALVLLFQFKISFILIGGFICHSIFTIYAYKKRAQFANSIFYSSINLLIWIIPIVVLSFLQIKQILVPLCFYIAIQTLLSIKYMDNKSQMVAKFLVLMQALMIALKADQKIQTPWKDVLFSHVVFFLFLSLCIIFMTAYLIYMKYTQNQNNLMKQKFFGALFIYFNTIAFCLISGLPLFNIFLDISIWVICFSLSFVLICLATFTYSYKNDIVIFFCTLNQIKSFNQIISFQPIQGIKDIKQKQLTNELKQKKSQIMYLYKISQNWLTKSPQKATQSQQQNPQMSGQQKNNQNKMTDCTICLDNPAQVVWMPCGHLTVCMQCCSFMFEKRNLNCVLCKKTPEQIFMIDIQQKQKQEQIQKTKSLDVSIQKDDVSVISGSIMLEIEAKSDSKKRIKDKNIKQMKKEKQKYESKKKFKVLEGYNVKII